MFRRIFGSALVLLMVMVFSPGRASAVTTGLPVLFSDGFEESGWLMAPISDAQVSWTIVNSGPYPGASPHAGSGMAYFNSIDFTSGSQARLYRDTGFAIPGSYDGVSLIFWVYHDTDYPGRNDQVQAQISTDGTTWNNVGPAVSRYDGTTGWAQSSIDLTAYKGQATVYLGFLGISASGNDIYLDDVSVVDQGSGLIVPTATTLAATSITGMGATLNGTANANYSLTTVTFEYGPTTSYGSSATAVPSPLTGSENTAVSAVISGLIPDSPYHFRVTGVSSAGTTYGSDRIFLTTSGGTTLFSDGFEGSGWFTAQVAGTAGAWTNVNSNFLPSDSPHSGLNIANFNSFDAASGSQTRLYRDTGFAIPDSYDGVILNFWIYHDSELAESNDQVQTQISTDGTTWNNVGSAVSRYDGTTGWAQSSIDLTPYKGQATVYLGFLGISAFGNNINLDDVSVVAQEIVLTHCSATVRVDAMPYGSLQSAMNAAGNGSVISATAHVITEDLMFSQPDRVTFKGGYDCTFSRNPGYTTINGILRVSGTGTLVAEKLIIRR